MAWIGLRFGPVVVGGAARSVPTRPWHLVAWPCCLYLGLISGFGLVGGLIGIGVGAGVAAVGLRLWRTYRCNRNALRPDPELFAAAARMAIRLRWA